MTNNITYHVTWTRLVPRIQKQGLRVMQTSNWIDGNGKRQGDGAVFAFASKWDAIRWAAKMDWSHTTSHGSGKVSILTLDDTREWDVDDADPLSQCIAEGPWLKAFRAIPPAAIVRVQPLTIELVQALAAHLREAA